MGVEQEPRRSRDLRILRRLRPYVQDHAGLLVVASLTLPLLAAAQLAAPYLLRLAIDRHVTPAAAGNAAALDGLWSLILVFLAIQVGEMAMRFVQLYLMQLAGQHMMHDLRMATFRHLQRLPMAFFDRNPIGRVMTRVTSDVETLNELMSQGIVAMARDLVTLVGIVAAMLWIDWRLTLASFVVLPLLVAILGALRVRLRDAYDRSRTLVARLNAFLQESLTGMGVIQVFGQQERKRDEFRALRDDLLLVDLSGVRYSSFLSASVQAATTVATALVLVYGGFGIVGGTVTVGLLVQFLEYLRRFYMPLEDLSDKYDTLQRAAASTSKIFALLDEPAVITSAVDAPPLVSFDHEIRLENLTFAYDDAAGQEVLKGIDLRLRRGEKVALVGATGAGKSSVVKVLQRLYDAQQGRVTVDGVDVREFDLGSLRRFFGTVPQDVFLFTDTIAANIGLGSEYVDGDAIRRAAALVEATDFINELPAEFDTRLGERGANLSFGERQLLAFARALASDPPVLVLDEATSSVDSETESRIQRALHNLVADRTALIVAHRLSTIREVDRIVVLHHGEVREEGTHEELLAIDGIYACLYRLQYDSAVGADSVERAGTVQA
ncbi:MAG TPA: ABC transporter ATP-binding protein [Acidobacteriota bacterium]|nr:ABC transporter ATP-binding protein [Acidobacteriota bacterium]